MSFEKSRYGSNEIEIGPSPAEMDYSLLDPVSTSVGY